MQVIDLWIISLIDSQRSIPEHVKTACSRCQYDRVCHVFFLTDKGRQWLTPRSSPSEFPGGLAYHRDSRNQTYRSEES